MENYEKELGLVSNQNIDILNRAGLNWEVRTEGLITTSGIVTDDIAVIRNDTNEVVGRHKEGYHALNNSKVLELMSKLSEMTGAKLHRGGSLKGGKLVYFQLETMALRIGNDLVQGYATGVNSHDGTVSLGIGPSSITISCANTFYMAYKTLEHKVKHTKNMAIKIEALALQFDKVSQFEKESFEKIKRLSEVQIDPKLRDLVMEEKLGDLSTLSTRKSNILDEINQNIAHQTNDKGQNLWGLFSGFTKYTTHTVKGSEIENKLVGTYGKRENLVFDMLVHSIK
jgi:hypothetical protein